MVDSVQCWNNLRIEYFKIWHLNSAYRARRFEIIHWINQLHFYDPQQSFRRKLWTSKYLSLESYLPTSERGCCWEFVEMKIWDRQSLLVCSRILSKSSLTRDDWISGWRSCLASLILNWCLVLAHHMWWCVVWKIRNPWIQLLRIRCWRRRSWICKNVSRFTMCVPNAWRPSFAARRYERRPQHPFRYWMRWKWHWSTGNVGILHCVLIQHPENPQNRSYNLLHFAVPVLSSRDRVEGRTLEFFVILPFL